MHDGGWPHLLYKFIDAAAISQVHFVMHEVGPLTKETRLIPARISSWPEKTGAHVVVNTMNAPACSGEKGNDL